TSGDFGLFGSVSGTIKNLNITASATITGAADNVGLLCGTLTGRIENCRAINCVINSTIPTSNGKGIHVGTLVGYLNTSGTNNGIYYSTVTGNVTGNGSVGGLVGYAESGIIKGCSFTGSVTGIPAGAHNKPDGVGGICGQASASVDLSFCFADATINAAANACGIICGIVKGNSTNHDNPSVGNVYAEGTVNGENIDSGSEITNSNSNTGLYFENYNGMTAQQIVDALNTAKGNDANFYFVVIENKVRMVVGSIVCEAPRNLRTAKVEGQGYTYNITWEAPAGVDNSFLESSHGNYQWTVAETANGMIGNSVTNTVGHNVFSLQHTLTGNALTYRVAIQTVCGNTRSEEIAVVINKQNDCKVQALQVSDIAYTSATATWEGNASKYKVRLMKDLQQVSETETENTTISFSNLEEGGDYTLTVIANCASGNETVVEGNNATANFTTKRLHFTTAQSGRFGDPSTWVGGVVPSAPAEMTIAQGHIITLHGDLCLTDNYKIVENKGVLAVYQEAQLINTTSTNVPGIVEIVAATNGNGKWAFIGAPFAGYKLGAVKPVSGSDIAMVKYDYANGAWSSDWAHVGNTVKAAEGTFAWPFYDGTTTYTTYGDLCTWVGSGADGHWVAGSYDFERTTMASSLNNGDVTVEETISNTSTSGGHWMALSNPYPAKLNIANFLASNNSLQGVCVYDFTDGSFDIKTTGDINMTEGFFVNFTNGGNKSVTFTKTQLTNYPSNPVIPTKASANEFIELTLVNGKDKVRAYLAHNENAEQGYDIFDANKMFATTGVAEPYFVTDGIALIKEEVAELPYYATMNVRSQQDTVMNFVLTNLPEGYAVSIIDGEEVIDMVEGGVYSTEILTGENADRFKVLVKKNVGIADVKDLDVTITNNNRHITITAQEDVKIEVYNTLGQRVFETSETNFVLSGVASGAYVVKVQGAKAAKSQKIILE
ncbi:MAG: T9SS type A sorting domain-containing protein, partial [Bacteroidales bacterium]|nr:T9SS type A sorting domain-containing protein [Bacteroidales bacterium]